MKTSMAACTATALLMVFAATEAAHAHGGYRHHHHRAGPRVGVFIGAPLVAYGWHSYRPWYPPAYYGAPAYYGPPAVVVPAPVVIAPPAPPVYVERGSANAAGAYWYYCPDTRAYYPYVGSCASPWERVAPQPQS